MRLCAKVVATPGTIAAICAMVACAGGADSEAEGPTSGRRSPPLGVAAQAADDDAWSVIAGADFNDDGTADVIWNDAGGKPMSVWLMNGTRPLAPGPDIPGPAGGGWVLSTATDFDGDGMADVLWNDAGRGLISVWTMNGPAPVVLGPEIPGPVGDGWEFVTADDFNNDGMADVLWSNPGKRLMAVWLMNGVRLLAPGPEIPGPVGDGWVALPAADLDADRRADTSGQVRGPRLSGGVLGVASVPRP